MICRNCGAQNPDDAKICDRCRQPLDAQSQNFTQTGPGYGQPSSSYAPPPPQGYGQTPPSQSYQQAPQQSYGQTQSPYAPPQGYGQAPPSGYGQPPSPYAPPPPGYQQTPPYGYGQPYQPNYYNAHGHPGSGAATASLVCGIISLFFAGLILGIIAITQGRKAKRFGYMGGRATAGIVMGIIGIIGWVIIVILVSAGVLSSAFLL